MLRLFAAFALMLGLATVTRADVPRPDNPRQTLALLDAAIRQADPQLDVVRDNATLALLITLPDGAVATVSPDNLHINLQAADGEAARAGVLADFVAGILGSVADMSAAATTDLPLAQIMPVLRAYDFLQDPDAATLPRQDFPGGLTVYWVVDLPTSTKSVSDEALAASGLTAMELAERALENLRRYATDVQHVDMGGAAGLVLDGYYESSLLLLPEIWQDIDRRLGTVVVAPIARDIVVYFDGEDPVALADMRGFAQAQFARVAYPISADLYRWEGDHWTLLP
jgi:uncharacterized protein YtpQ (UPF0354 family)